MPIRSEKPLEYSGQVWRGIDDKFPKKIHNATTTSDGLMSAEDKAKLDSIDATADDRVYPKAEPDLDGLMSKEDKTKLDSIDVNELNELINYHDYIIAEEFRHVTDSQIEYWNAKASTTVVNHTVNGLMYAEDKVKLDGIEAKANNYIHPNNETIRHVTDDQIKKWDAKAETYTASQLRDGLMSAADKTKLDSLQNYIHPNNSSTRHVEDAEKVYWNSKADKTVVTNSEDGLMSSKDKVKLDSIEEGANNYVHPEDENTRHVTDEQIKYWDSKGSTEVASQFKNGLMSAEDKRFLEKLNLIDRGLQETHFVTDEQIEYWNNKINPDDLVTDVKDGLMSYVDKVKLDGIELHANNYIHPDTELIRHVTDEQIRFWNEKASTDLVSDSNHGLMISADKVKLDGIQPGANNYIHPDNATMRHVTDEEKQYWNNKAGNTPATQDQAGLMSIEDKQKLDSIEENANNYIHPDDENTRHVTDEEKEYWNNKAENNIVTQDTAGLMSAEDKTKLDNIEDLVKDIESYTHPETHPATMITEDEIHRFVTDEEKEYWNSKSDIEQASYEKAGLMSAEDKLKLDGIEKNANKYTHPETHLATMIVQDETHRFVTDEEKERWDNSMPNIREATPESPGLMSAEDKAKLDSLSSPESHEISLVYSDWSEEAPYIQTIEVPGIAPSVHAYIGISSTATMEEMAIAAEAKLEVESVEEGKISIIAKGTKPDRDLPILIMYGNNIIICEVNHYTPRFEYVYEPPTEGYHYENEIIYSMKPVESGCIGWVCIQSGEPGEWLPFGTL